MYVPLIRYLVVISIYHAVTLVIAVIIVFVYVCER